MQRTAAVLLALAISAGPLRAQTPQAAFSDGLADRQAYEAWFAGLQGDYKNGAFFWSGQRSKKSPAACSGPTQDWVRGCLDAKQRLDPTDRRRLAEPDYRLGWNSYVPQPAELQAASAPVPATSSVEPFRECLAISSGVSRLDCYDAAARAVGSTFADTTPQTTTPLPADAGTVSKPAASADQSDPSKDCKDDWKGCKDAADLVNNWKGFVDVQVKCEMAAKDMASYGDPSFPWFPFSHFKQGAEFLHTGKFIAAEPEARFSNAFGAMVHTGLLCQYDLNKGAVIDVVPVR